MGIRNAQRAAKHAELMVERDRLLKFETRTAPQDARLHQIEIDAYELRREDLVDALAGGGLTLESGSDDGGSGTPAPAPGMIPGRSTKFAGDPWKEPVGELRAGVRPGALRGQAVSAVERCGALSDASREKAVRDIEADDDPTAALARLTVELSQPQYRSAFLRWMADPEHGHYEWSNEERDAVRRVGTVTRSLALGGSGGYLAPYELDPSIVLAGTGVVDPMRSVSRVVTSAHNEKRFVTSVGVTASWDAESAEVSDDTPTLLQPAVTCFKGQAFVPVSYELFEDTDVAAQVGALFADAKTTLEGTAFTTGTGTGQPKGVVTALIAAGGSTVIATGTNVLAAGDPMAAQAALPPRWRPRARFMMNLSVLNGYRVLVKSASLTESLVDDSGPVPRMFGWPVTENSGMDGTLGAGADYVLLCGDFQQYVIVDRLGTSVELVPHLFGAAHRPTGERGFLMHWRTGADVLVPDAFRLSNFNT